MSITQQAPGAVASAEQACLPCQSQEPELFFAEDPGRIEAAKSICLGCPVRIECLVGALRRREPHGVWGGELLLDGVAIVRKRPRGRPRKDAVAGQPAVIDLEMLLAEVEAGQRETGAGVRAA